VTILQLTSALDIDWRHA